MESMFGVGISRHPLEPTLSEPKSSARITTIFGGTDCAKAEEAKAQTMSSKGRRALLIVRSLLKLSGVDPGRRHCLSSPHDSRLQKLCLILIAIYLKVVRANRERWRFSYSDLYLE